MTVQTSFANTERVFSKGFVGTSWNGTRGIGLWNCREGGGMTQMTQGMKTHRGRLILVALILVLGAFWVGARYGPKQAEKVEARRIAAVPTDVSAKPVAARNEALTEEESINVRIYRQASPAVANILTKATEYDFFM